MVDFKASRTPVRFGFVRPARVVTDLEQWVGEAESLGAQLFGFGDSQTMWGDPYVALARAAAASERALLGPWVTVPSTRDPTVAASSIMTIQELSGGRAFFGVGPGDSAVYNAGRRGATLAELEAYALVVRSLTRGGRVEYDGRSIQMHWSSDPVPLWLAADGEKMLQLAGRIADGIIVGNGATPELVRFAVQNIERGAREAGRDPDTIETWFMVRMMVAPSRDHGVEQLKFYLASYANVRFRRAMFRKGVEVTPEIAERIRGFRADFDGSDAYRVDSARNTALLDKWGLTDWLARQFLVTGPPEEILYAVRELLAAGARNLAIPQMLPDAVDHTRVLAEQVLHEM